MNNICQAKLETIFLIQVASATYLAYNGWTKFEKQVLSRANLPTMFTHLRQRSLGKYIGLRMGKPVSYRELAARKKNIGRRKLNSRMPKRGIKKALHMDPE